MTETTGLFESLALLSQPVTSLFPQPMEMLDQDYGFILYRTHISGPRPEAIFHARQVHDRAQVFLDGQFQAIFERETGDEFASFEIPASGSTVDLLVENMGRVNFGPGLLDRKGLLDGATFAGQLQFGWETFPLPLNDLSKLKFEAVSHPGQASENCPAFYRATFIVDDPADTFLAMPGWTKGVAWLNGFNLGRYWERGPQMTLYVPAPFLKHGKNELIIFELHNVKESSVEFRDKSDLGEP
jgi:beta-galactosidase